MSAMNFGRFIDLARFRRESSPALITEDSVWTYGQLAESTEAVAVYLDEQGVRRGDRVAILAMNCAEYVCCVLAIYRLGAIAVPLNYRLPRAELEYLLADSGSVAVICESQYLPVMTELVAGQPLHARLRVDVGLDGDGESVVTGWDSFAAVVRQFAGRHIAVTEVRATDAQRIMYTSGTTSRPKGAIVTHEMAAYNVSAHATELDLTSADTVLVSSPLYHVAAWDSPGIGVLFHGGALVIMRRFEPMQALRLIEKHHVTGAHLVRTIVAQLQLAADDTHDLSSLRWIIIGGLSPEVYVEVAQLLAGTRLVQGYGMTEACSAISFIDAAHALSKLGSVGTAVPFVEFRVVDEVDLDVAPGVQGEVVIRGPKVTPGYWGDVAATESAWRGGWFHTGDGGVIDEDGYLTITDRIKDMIKSGGENIASTEIERVLYTHPAVAEVAVIGVPDPLWQEVPKAFVVLKSGALATAAELIVHCREQLASFKTPKSIEILSELPHNASGKVLKRTLRDLAPHAGELP